MTRRRTPLSFASRPPLPPLQKPPTVRPKELQTHRFCEESDLFWMGWREVKRNGVRVRGSTEAVKAREVGEMRTD